MQVDFDTKITDALGRIQYEPELTPSGLNVLVPAEDDDGSPIMRAGSDGKPEPVRVPKVLPITLGALCVTALTRAWPDERLTEAMAFDRFMLAMKIAPGGVIDMSLEDRAKVQAATDNWHKSSPIFMARARLILDTSAAE